MRVMYLNKLSWIRQKADESFWEAHWEKIVEKELQRAHVPGYIRRFTASLSLSARILEAGCGTGAIVKGLVRAGFLAQGIDIAQKTIQKIKEHGLKADVMDVRHLDFSAETFDAYISLGVIEHFLDERDARDAITEAVRVLKKGGLLFCSVPYFNILRRRLSQRLSCVEELAESDYYQRSYSKEQFEELFEGRGLKLLTIDYYDIAKGLGDEVPLRALKRRPLSAFCQVCEKIPLFRRLFSHMIYGVFQRI